MREDNEHSLSIIHIPVLCTSEMTPTAEPCFFVSSMPSRKAASVAELIELLGFNMFVARQYHQFTSAVADQPQTCVWCAAVLFTGEALSCLQCARFAHVALSLIHI